MTTTIKVQERGVITLPKRIRERAGLSTGVMIDLEERDGAIVMRPVSRLDPDLLADVESALDDLRMGRASPIFSSIAEFKKYMSARHKGKRASR